MTTTLMLIASGILIGAGITVFWRDIQRSRRKAFVVPRDAAAATDAEVEITIARGDDGTARKAARAKAPVLSASAPAPLAEAEPDRTAEEEARRARERQRQAAIEERWVDLQPTLAAGVANVNAVLNPGQLAVGSPGDAAWSYKNEGFGHYRRLLVGDVSVAWLRVELCDDDRLHARVKAHKDNLQNINAAADAPAGGLSPVGVADLLSVCLKPAAAIAAHGALMPDAQYAASERAWNEVDGIAAAALKATNGAFVQAGAWIVPRGPPMWEEDVRRHRLTLAVMVYEADVARMHIERIGSEMEVAVGVRDAGLIDLGRRRRIAIAGMSVHSLAELIASCAWPVIGRYRDTRMP
ncbi:MAG: hypothetical protein F9K29_05175 [Hyphomicrobiaceae bacterium]|nr:MAG: hypothetical protein F9K29_05175 [Hyphomicrobiaceae bacterium]